MAFHHEADQAFALGRGFGEELLGGGEDRLLIAADLDLRHGFHRDRDTLLGVEVLLRRHVERHELQRQLPAAFDHGENNGAVPLDHAGAAESIDDERLIRAGFAEHSG